MKITKEIFPEIFPNTYYLNFDFNSEFTNYYFVNFDSVEEIKNFVKKEGILKLYNDWLDFIGNSDYICEDQQEAEECCSLAKVISVGEEDVLIEIIPFSLGDEIV